MALVEGLNEDVSTYDPKAKYDEFNRLYFDGVLPDIPIEFASLKGVGAVVLCRILHATKALEPGSLRMRISNKFKKTEAQLDALLLHEMIHVYLISRGHYREQHGPRFKAMLRVIREKSGIDVPMTEDEEGELVDSTAKPLGVLLVHKMEGGFTFAITTEKAAHADLEEVKADWSRRVGSTCKMVEVYTITSETWTNIAANLKVQRGIGGKKLKAFFKGQHWPEAITELRNQGTLLARIEP